MRFPFCLRVAIYLISDSAEKFSKVLDEFGFFLVALCVRACVMWEDFEKEMAYKPRHNWHTVLRNTFSSPDSNHFFPYYLPTAIRFLFS